MKRLGLIVVVFASAAANASPVLVGGTATNPAQVDGVLVNGTTYDVTFSAFDISNPPPGDFSAVGSTAAGAATVALAEAFNGLNITGINNTLLSGLGASGNLNVLVNLQLKSGSTTFGYFDAIQGNPANGPGQGFGLTPDGPWIDFHAMPTAASMASLSAGGGAVEYATFTPVPLPASAWLMAGGLFGLFRLARRRAV